MLKVEESIELALASEMLEEQVNCNEITVGKICSVESTDYNAQIEEVIHSPGGCAALSGFVLSSLFGCGVCLSNIVRRSSLDM